MSAIVEFVLARIAEDEAAAHEAWMRITGSAQRNGKASARCALAKCEANRAIVELSRPRHYTNDDDCWYSCDAAQLGVDTDNPDALSVGDEDCTCGFDGTTPILKVLAAVYADHADYDETWRP